MRNLFQVNVEEGRHLWAMVYLLHAYFGRDGREEAETLLYRHSGDRDHPRILGTFNEPIDDWLSFFMFTYFTDRDGKYQLKSLAESGFDPLARTCRFMLTEEAHHMSVGAGGVGRVVQRTAELMLEHDITDVTPFGGINLDTIQRYLNLHFSVSLDLFGAERSTNAANYFAAGLKGRYQEATRLDDHRLHAEVQAVPEVSAGRILERQAPALSALNATLRDDYVADCQKGLDRWNRAPGCLPAPSSACPHAGFHRQVGAFAGHSLTPGGHVITGAEWEAPAGRVAAHLSRPGPRGVGDVPGHRTRSDGQLGRPARGPASTPRPLDFEYVRT
jgi:benzoyl-CoA 2,3-dioxygenase component B